MSQEQERDILKEVLKGIAAHGAGCIADIARLSARYVFDVGSGKTMPSEKVLSKLYAAVKGLEKEKEDENELRLKIKQLMKKKMVSLRVLAKAVKIDPSNLSKTLSGARTNNKNLTSILDTLVLFPNIHR